MSDPSVTVSFDSKHPHTTFWITVQYPEASPPDDLFGALAAIGFVADSMAPLPPLDGRSERTLGKRGTGLFAGWTPEEARANTGAARQVLARFGFRDVPRNKLTWQELV